MSYFCRMRYAMTIASVISADAPISTCLCLSDKGLKQLKQLWLLSVRSQRGSRDFFFVCLFFGDKPKILLILWWWFVTVWDGAAKSRDTEVEYVLNLIAYILTRGSYCDKELHRAHRQPVVTCKDYIYCKYCTWINSMPPTLKVSPTALLAEDKTEDAMCWWHFNVSWTHSSICPPPQKKTDIYVVCQVLNT